MAVIDTVVYLSTNYLLGTTRGLRKPLVVHHSKHVRRDCLHSIGPICLSQRRKEDGNESFRTTVLLLTIVAGHDRSCADIEA